MEIADWRKRIDEIDAQLAELLCERSRCVNVGKIFRSMTLNGKRKFLLES